MTDEETQRPPEPDEPETAPTAVQEAPRAGSRVPATTA